MIGIYKITNLINNKKYVGQTIRSLSSRMVNHKSSANTGKPLPLYDAMREYGFDSFKIEMIEECSYDELNDREIYWINKLESTVDKHGYNTTLGGNKNQKVTDPLYLYNGEIVELLKNTNLNYKQIADNYNVSRYIIGLINSGKRWFNEEVEYPIRSKPTGVTKVLKKCKVCGKRINYASTYCTSHNPTNISKKRPPKEILEEVMYNNNYNKFAVGKLYGVSDNTIKKWCIKYNIKYQREKIVKVRKILEIPKEVWMLDKVTKEVVKVFNSVREANLYFGVKYNDGNISRCVRGLRHSAHGYKWEYKY